MPHDALLLVKDVEAFADWLVEYQGFVRLPDTKPHILLRVTGNGNVDDEGNVLYASHVLVVYKPRRGDVADVPDRNLQKLVKVFLYAKPTSATGRVSRQQPEAQYLRRDPDFRPQTKMAEALMDMDFSPIEVRVEEFMGTATGRIVNNGDHIYDIAKPKKQRDV